MVKLHFERVNLWPKSIGLPKWIENGNPGMWHLVIIYYQRVTWFIVYYNVISMSPKNYENVCYFLAFIVILVLSDWNDWQFLLSVTFQRGSRCIVRNLSYLIRRALDFYVYVIKNELKANEQSWRSQASGNVYIQIGLPIRSGSLMLLSVLQMCKR